MSGWQELKAERNRRSALRLTKALPPIFPRIVRARALARPFVPPTPRIAIESYWRAHPIRADRLDLAARGPQGRPAFHVSARHPQPGFCCVCGQPVYRLGWHADFGAAVPTGMRCGTAVLASSDFGGVFKVGAALKPAAGCGGTPAKLLLSYTSGDKGAFDRQQFIQPRFS